MILASPAKYLDGLLRDAGWVELCHIDGGRIWSAWYDQADALLAAAIERQSSGNLYTTLNSINRNALFEYLTAQRHAHPGGNSRTCDEHVTRFCRLFFDLDPVRPPEISSTDAELDEARLRAEVLRSRLYRAGWPLPARAVSGNGWHLHYRVALPNTAEVREQLRWLYRGLQAECSDDLVCFDLTVRNPGRLCTLYGSIKRKGPNTPKRPHRQAQIWLPQDWRQVTAQQIDGLANHYAREIQAERTPCNPALPLGGSAVGNGDYSGLDVVAWFQAHGAYRFPIEGRKHSVWCPWQDGHTTEHGRTGAVIFAADGSWPGIHCHHSHCAGRGIREVIARWGDADRFCTQLWRGT